MIFTSNITYYLYVNDTGNLRCDALGGPRLRLTIQREDGTIVATGAMGDNNLTYNFIAGNNFGQYTCNAIIDDRQINESQLVVGTYIQLLLISLCAGSPIVGIFNTFM